MPQTEAWITMGCVDNEVGGPLVDTALWQGVLLADVLRAARPRPGATQVVGRSVDGYTGAFGPTGQRAWPDAVVGPGRQCQVRLFPNRPRALVGAERWGG